MTTDVVGTLLSFLIGLGLGFFYVGTLWLTVRALPSLRYPAAWTFFSFLVRIAVVLVVFVSVTQGGPYRMLAVLAGFVILRVVLVRAWGGRSKSLAERTGSGSSSTTMG